MQTGLAAEQAVCDDLVRSGWRVVERRLRTPFAEVDLFLEDPFGNYFLFEVKAVRAEFFESGVNVSFAQLQRLRRACFFLERRVGRVVLLQIAAVGRDGSIEYFEPD